MPNEIFTFNLNAQAIVPEAFILFGIIGTLIVDLAGEKTASRFTPIICYLSLSSSLTLTEHGFEFSTHITSTRSPSLFKVSCSGCLKSIEKNTLDGTTEGALGSTVNLPIVNLTISLSSQISS